MADTPARRRPAKPGASTSRPGAKKAAATKPGAKKPVAKKPATKKPGAKKPAQKPGVKKPGAKPGAKRPAKKLSWPKRILLGAFFTVFTVTVLGAVALVIAYNRVQLPAPNAEFETQTTQVFFGDAVHQPDGSVTGTLLGELAEQNRTSVEFSDMPQSMRDSVIAAENRGFWTDPGISISGILRSAKNIAMGEPLQSGSTITQQYIKTLYLTSDQTPSRKAKEILLAVKMGRGGLARKQDVLQGYLNTIWFGRGAYGVQAAAQTYFGVDARDLTLPQSAALAAILNQPAWLDPLADPENIPRFTERYRYVLDGLLLLGEKAAEDPPQPFVGITQAEYDDALANPPEFPTFDQPDLYAGDRGFLLKMVEDELIDNGFYSEDQVQGGGLKIVTTFDQAAQAAAATAVQQQTQAAAESAATPQDAGQLHGALASIEVGTGEVVALYGGPDYIANQQNWALTRRQAGSTFKPYAMLAGLRAGMNLQTPLNGNTFTPQGDPTPVYNDSYQNLGSVSLAYATTHSVNTAYVDLVLKTPDGPNQVIQAANDLGVPTDDSWQATGRIALGSAEVSPLSAANAFATVANDGQYVPFHVVREVWEHGELRCLWGTKIDATHCSAPAARQAVESSQAATMNYALRSVMSEGTGSRSASSFPWPVAGKTGSAGDTDQAMRAAWFIGYTKQISTAVMFVAGSAGVSDLNAYMPAGSSFYGGTYPGNVWHDYMTQAMAGKDPLPFEQPSDKGATTLQPLPTPVVSTPPPEPTASAPTPEPESSAPTVPPTPAPPTSESPPEPTEPAGGPGGPSATEPSEPAGPAGGEAPP